MFFFKFFSTNELMLNSLVNIVIENEIGYKIQIWVQTPKSLL